MSGTSGSLSARTLQSLGGLVPQVRVIRTPEHSGILANGNSAPCHAAVRITLQDLPPDLLQPELELTIELGRWVRSKRRRQGDGTLVRRGSGFVHPSDWTGAATLNPHGLSNRGGRHVTAVPRPTSWPVTQQPNGVIVFLIGDVFACWFTDGFIGDHQGNPLYTLRYHNGRALNGIARNVKGYPGNSYRGFFVFRYSIYNPQTQTRESGPWSDVVCVQPLNWPTKPSNLFPCDSVVITAPTAIPGAAQLTASMTTHAKSSVKI